VIEDPSKLKHMLKGDLILLINEIDNEKDRLNNLVTYQLQKNDLQEKQINLCLETINELMELIDVFQSVINDKTLKNMFELIQKQIELMRTGLTGGKKC